MINEFMLYWKEWFQEKQKIVIQKSFWSSISMILPQIASALILVYVGIKILNKTLSIGDFTLYSSLIVQFSGGIGSIFSSFTQTYENEIKLNNFKSFLGWKTKLVTNGKMKIKSPVVIEFRNVSFKYPDTERYILKEVSFKIDKYEKVALVGLNGAGKSTIIKLMLRLYDPTEGTIFINSINIKEYDIEGLRKTFGVVFQDFCCYALKLRENITIADIENDTDDETITAACHAAGMDALLKKFSNNLDIYLTKQFDDKGEELSGGEWQKIAIARAYFQNSEFMIMDEPTSSLDPEAEYAMFETLTNLCKKKGAIFISHRLSSVTMADRILVLENGKIIESGSHKELMQNKGQYAHLFTLQAERYIP